MTLNECTLASFADNRNASKLLFTPGPAALLWENLEGLRPCFGRGDEDYAGIETRVLRQILAMSGQAHIARLQGSASLAIEIATRNFLSGRVLVVESGYYSERLVEMSKTCIEPFGPISRVTTVRWQEIAKVDAGFDWVVACYTETSNGTLIPVTELRSLADRAGARLMLDATASIGLEGGHELGDVVAFSSCKGLFGLTGASFVTYNEKPQNEVRSFYLSLDSHINKSMTGPYHAICSLDSVLPRHAQLREAVVANKRRFRTLYGQWIPLPESHQPLLCTRVDAQVTTNEARAVLYVPRLAGRGSVVCHLGEVHLGTSACGAILDSLAVTPLNP